MSKFTQLSKATIQNNKNIIISVDDENKISVAQQLVVDDNGIIQHIFLKNAINTDVEGLKNIKMAIEAALEKIEKNKKVS